MNPSKALLRKLHREWLHGRTKNDIEREVFNDPASHGKYITRMWREILGIETEEEHPLVIENRALKETIKERDDEIRRLKLWGQERHRLSVEHRLDERRRRIVRRKAG